MSQSDDEAAGGRSYTRSRTVEWGDSDPAALINSPRVFDFAVETIEGFYRDVLGISFVDLLRDRHMGAPFVHASCEFQVRLYESQTVTLELRIERLGKSSVAWCVDAVRDVETVFQVRMTSSFIDLASDRAVAIPADFRKCMERYVRAE